jgi:hypothetical protein
MMAGFGWSYPPGCSGVPADEHEYCEVCLKLEPSCKCPECPECGEVGRLDCYHPKTGHGLHDPAPIKDVETLARICYGWAPVEGGMGASKAVERAVYKYTTCGACFSQAEYGVRVSGYVEGTDAECPSHTLDYPFAESAWWEALAICEKEAGELWDETHGCDGCGELGGAVDLDCPLCGGNGIVL